MERTHLTATTELGCISVSAEAVAQLVGHTAAECYGVVGMASRGRLPRLLARSRLTKGIVVEGRDNGLAIDLRVIVEYGLNLAEVAATVRSRISYEVERLTGLKVVAVEVHVADVRRG
ncbi:MAG: Asp23/Gls24 family envelope stress response protein [Gaiellaceae bacterium]